MQLAEALLAHLPRTRRSLTWLLGNHGVMLDYPPEKGGTLPTLQLCEYVIMQPNMLVDWYGAANGSENPHSLGCIPLLPSIHVAG